MKSRDVGIVSVPGDRLSGKKLIKKAMVAGPGLEQSTRMVMENFLSLEKRT